MKRLLYILIFPILLMSCGTTKILTSSGEGTIVISGSNKRSSSVEITRTGIPKKLTVYADVNGVKYGETVVKRKFDLVTLVVGFYTYGIGFLTCWRYPSTIVIDVPSTQENNLSSLPVWSQPPRIWGDPNRN